ncbi:MAG: carboxypeptidase regulatory-like domain-containing protein [Gemmatimonadaceae bacterium]
MIGIRDGLLACAIGALGAGAGPHVGVPAARVAGFVYDSLARAPLAGAHVQVVPVDATLLAVDRRTTQSDSGGRFVFEDVPAGRYLVGFFHPKLDSLGVEPPLRRVDIRGGRELTLDLAVPSAGSIITAWCGRGAAGDSSGVIVGYVRDVNSMATLSGATVAAQWSSITITERGARAGVQQSSARTNTSGGFGVCGVPRGAVLVLRASAETDSSALLELDVPDDGVLIRDIALSRGTALAGPLPSLRGTVRDVSGQPLVGARLRLWGTSVEARANEAGEFRFAAPSAGTQLIDARMIGFVPLRRVVDVSPHSGANVDLVMHDFPMEIDTVRVLSRRPTVHHDALVGFERRRKLGHGVFLDPDAIEIRRPLVFTDLMRGLPGVSVRSIDMMTRSIQMRATNGNETCLPVLVVDGVRLPLHDMNVDDVIPAELVRAVEVYPRRIQAPPEYQETDCGSVVVWTGLRGWLAKRLAKTRGP